jgi:RNA polymerase sigma-70 factor (sigma-E family)
MTQANGEGPDFEDFVTARSRSLFRTAYLLADSRESAEDLLQSALEKAYPRWRRIRRAEQPEAYVRRMIVNLANDAWRSRNGVLVYAFDEQQFEARVRAGLVHQADPADRLAVRDSLMRALRDLPFQMRAALVLRYWEGLSERETAELLGCSLGSVKSQTSRGLQRLRAVIGAEAPGTVKIDRESAER